MKANDTMKMMRDNKGCDAYQARGVHYIADFYDRQDDNGSVVISAVRESDDVVLWSGCAWYSDSDRIIDTVRAARENAATAKADGY